jgi:serine/threonine protein kinase
VALKVLRKSDAASNQQLLDEARAASAFNHPNVCTIHNVDTANGATMIVMEHVAGRTLSDILKDGPIEIAAATRLIRQIAGGMAAAHDAGVVHGDVKPANLMVTPNEDFLPHRSAPTTGPLGSEFDQLARCGLLALVSVSHASSFNRSCLALSGISPAMFCDSLMSFFKS